MKKQQRKSAGGDGGGSPGRVHSSNNQSPKSSHSSRVRKTHPRSEGSPTNAPNATNGHTSAMASRNKVAGEETPGFLSRFYHNMLMPVFLMFFVPNLGIVLWYTACRCDGSYLELISRMNDSGYLSGLINIWLDINIGSALSVYILAGYMLFALLLMIILPGPRAEGPLTSKGNLPVYKDNGFKCYVVTMVTLVGLTYWLKQRGLSPTIVYDHFDEFLGTLTVFSHILCVILHLKGLICPSTTDSGSSGNLIFDYYWGTELYPRIFGIDIKVFTNCRFGMTVWPVLVFIFALKSYELHGFVDSMWVSGVLQLIYCTKFFWWEAGYMRTIDIMVDRAGFYICWGCLVFIPAMYTSVSLYLVKQPVHLGPVLAATIFILGALSILVNYWADHQKQVVRRTNGQCTIWGKRPQVIRAKYHLEDGKSRDSLLLLSGFWGLSRHFHYVPEIMLSFFWSLPALFSHLMVYSYVIYLTILLVHRSMRDEEKCQAKYTKYWSEYCKRVPYKILPKIY